MEDKEKQILEMEKTMRKVYVKYGVVSLPLFAQELYNAGYRKIDKDSVVLSKEEYKLLTNDLDKGDYGDFERGYSQAHKEMLKDCIESNKKAEQIGYEKGSKETAEKFAILLKAKMPCEEVFKGVWHRIDETAKQFGVEIKE